MFSVGRFATVKSSILESFAAWARASLVKDLATKKPLCAFAASIFSEKMINSFLLTARYPPWEVYNVSNRTNLATPTTQGASPGSPIDAGANGVGRITDA